MASTAERTTLLTVRRRMEFDTGTNGTATLTLTNVTHSELRVLRWPGRRICRLQRHAIQRRRAMSPSPTASSRTTIPRRSKRRRRRRRRNLYYVHSRATMSNSQVLNNTRIPCEALDRPGAGGGIVPAGAAHAAAEPFHSMCTISGNTAAGWAAESIVLRPSD